QYQSQSGAESNLQLAMPSGPNISQAIAQLYGIATNDGITVQSIGISPPVVQPQSAGAKQIVKPMGSIAFQFTATGSYENFKNFLNDLESNIRIFDVTTLSLQSTGAGTKAATDNYAYGITVDTYYQVP